MNLEQIPISKETGDALLKPAAESTGNAFKTVLDGIFHLALDPVRKFNIQREYDLEKFKKEVYRKTQELPSENLDDSQMGIVLKAIEDSRYQLNNDDIRMMFAKLIASTFDNRINSTISPKYSSIIADMGPKEAKLLELIFRNRFSVVPIVDLKVKNINNHSERTIKLNALLLDSGPTQDYALELSLLESANLIKFRDDFRLTNPHFEQIISDYTNSFSPDLGIVFSNLVNTDQETIDFHHSSYFLTELGKSFCEIVFSN